MSTWKLFAWGANSHGQLGLGFKSEQELASEVQTDASLADIKQISCGARHAVILDKNGRIFITGKNELNGNASKFVQMDSIIEFSYVACGWDVTAAISDQKLFVWGNNSSNQLGLANKGAIKEPTEVSLPDNEIAVEIKFGLKHSAILTKSNHILVTGSLRYFRQHAEYYRIIHHNSVEWLRVMTKTDVDDVTHFSCGQNHIAFVTGDGTINGIGDNRFGQCARIEAEEKVVTLQSGWTHNAYLTESNQLHLYGRNSYGQLGCGFKSNDFIAQPQKCSIKPIDKFAIGSEHCVLSADNRIYTFGWNEHRNCGHDTDDDILVPTQLRLLGASSRVNLIAAGSGFCMVLLEAS